MSGVPGSGKSTLARELASRLHAVVLDHDDTKSAILASGISQENAGAASYEVIKSLSSRILGQSFSVIIDSPCLYTELLDHGIRTAAVAGASYRYVECVLADMNELERRLSARDPKPSQVKSLDQMFSHAGARPKVARELVEEWAVRMPRPDFEYLELDTTMPLDACVSKAMSYIVGEDKLP